MKQTNMRMLALCAALCLCVATAAPAYAESTRQTPRTSFVETLLDIPVLGDILRFFSGEEPLSQAATAETATGETATPETSTPETAPTATPETATPTPAPTPGGSSTPESAATLPPTGTPQVYPAPDIVVMPTATPAITAAPQQEEENNTSDEPPAAAATSAPAAATATQRPAAAIDNRNQHKYHHNSLRPCPTQKGCPKAVICDPHQGKCARLDDRHRMEQRSYRGRRHTCLRKPSAKRKHRRLD